MCHDFCSRVVTKLKWVLVTWLITQKEKFLKTIMCECMSKYLKLCLIPLFLFPVDASALTLKETVLHTLQTNPEILAAKNELESRKYEVKQARSGYLPSVSLDAGIGEERRKSPATGNETVDLTRTELGLSASQLLFDGFTTSSEVKRQKARVESAEYQLLSTSEDLALRTSRVYLDILRHAELLDLARAALWEHQNIHDQMKLRYETGVGSKADFDQIESRLALANANMIVAQNNFADTQSNFHRLTGMHPTLESLSQPALTASLPATRELGVEKAIADHPVLKSAASDLKSARQQYKSAKGSYFPRIDLEVDRRWDSDIGGIEGDDDDTIVALRLRYDLFKGGSNKARRKQTAYLAEEAKDIRNNARRQIIESLNLSWNAFDAVTAQLTYLNKHVESARATKEAYKKQFNIGKRTLLDLLNTENEVTDSKRALINAQYDQLYSHYRILNSMGILVDSI